MLRGRGGDGGVARPWVGAAVVQRDRQISERRSGASLPKRAKLGRHVKI